ncbi:MAG: hypothetical protein CVU81_02280 [Euryarchaeota archaeon HGW-Euryarchaeota-1]|nr:MAG: hypothetical protein CVU81_02280 [Euryarchaeota archaeon HGW-Euryarchaeota-1]
MATQIFPPHNNFLLGNINVMKTFHTPKGVITRKLTPQEMAEAFKDNEEVKKEVLKAKIKNSTTDKQKLDAILEYLDIK